MANLAQSKQIVVNQLIESIEKGCAPWECSWNQTGSRPPIQITGKRYQGINFLSLLNAQRLKGFDSNRWLTFNAIKQNNGWIKKGEEKKYSFSFYFRFIETKNKETNKIDKIPFMRYSMVWNCDQVQYLPEHLYNPPSNEFINKESRNDFFEKWMAKTKARFEHGGDQACYVPTFDYIRLPKFDQFKDSHSYYSTAFHELGHWTGATTRLDRLAKGAKFGSYAYAFEELIAELTSAFTMANYSIDRELRPDHARYLSGWISAMKEKPDFLFSAASMAGKASSMLEAFKPCQ